MTGQTTSFATPPLVECEVFQGPLDFLLEEVRRQNVAIEKVALAPAVSRFLEYVHTAGRRNLNLDIEWLHMAAILIHWKSLSLLPGEASGESRDRLPDELVEQLLVHKQRLAGELARRRAAEEASFSRLPGESLLTLSEESAAPVTTVWDLIQQAREIAAWIPRYRQAVREAGATFAVTTEDVPLAEMILYLRGRLMAAGRAGLDAAELLNEEASLSRRVALFLAMLEMARDGLLDMAQSDTFAPISLTPVGLSNPPQVNQ